MSLLEILLIALGMAMDAFAASLGAGTVIPPGPRPVFRISFHFGLFQALMPILGWLLGNSIEPLIAAYDHWVAFGLLAFVGGRMIRSAMRAEGETLRGDPSRGWNLLMLSIATSLDSLAIGLSLALIGVLIWVPALVIGVVTGGLSLVGLWVSGGFGRRFGRPVEVAGGLILIFIGLRILVTHLSA